jgi:hypothetical protein
MSIFDHFNKSNDDQRAIEIIRRKCAEAGWAIKGITKNGVVLSFKTIIGVENIFVKRCGSNKQGEMILEKSSDGIKLPNDIANAALMSLELMERNGEMIMCHWGIETVDGTKLFTVMHSAVASTLDKEELEAAVHGCLDERKHFILTHRQK